jgi:colicin import membrane protein
MAAADSDEHAKKGGADAKSAAEAKAKANAEIYEAMLQNVSYVSNRSTLNTARQASVAGATERSPRDAQERSPREKGAAAAISAMPGKPLLRPRETDPAAATGTAKEAGIAQAAAAKASAEPVFSDSPAASDKPAAAAAAAEKKRQERETWVAKGAAAPRLPEEVNAKGEALLRAAARAGGRHTDKLALSII